MKEKRATLAAEIVDLERKLRHRKDSLVHIDAALQILDPSIDPDSIPTKRISRRVKLFRQGELGRMVRDALREAGKPISAPEIVTYMLKVGGHGEEARKAVAQRVRGNLAFLQRKGVVVKTGELREAKWGLAASPKA